MRTIRLFSAVAVVALSAAGAWAQPAGNGFGFRASGGSPQEPSYLLSSESVQKELKLSSEQKVKLKKIRDEEESGNHPFFRGITGKSPEEIQQSLEQHAQETRERIAKILAPEQLHRMNEINIQVVGVDALNYDDVAKSLGLTATQRDELKNLADETRRKLAELNSTNGRLPANDARRVAWKARQDEVIAERKMGALAILTDEQKSKFDELHGEKFDTSTVVRNRKSFSRRGRIDGPVLESPPAQSPIP
jgi:Spy/CpxP family protein refolding chaperone